MGSLTPHHVQFEYFSILEYLLSMQMVYMNNESFLGLIKYWDLFYNSIGLKFSNLDY